MMSKLNKLFINSFMYLSPIGVLVLALAQLDSYHMIEEHWVGHSLGILFIFWFLFQTNGNQIVFFFYYLTSFWLIIFIWVFIILIFQIHNRLLDSFGHHWIQLLIQIFYYSSIYQGFNWRCWSQLAITAFTSGSQIILPFYNWCIPVHLGLWPWDWRSFHY